MYAYLRSELCDEIISTIIQAFRSASIQAAELAGSRSVLLGKDGFSEEVERCEQAAERDDDEIGCGDHDCRDAACVWGPFVSGEGEMSEASGIAGAAYEVDVAQISPVVPGGGGVVDGGR